MQTPATVDPPASPVPPTTERRAFVWLRRWPSVLGLAVASFLLVTGAADVTTLAITTSAAALCYLAAAALGRPWIAWASIPGASFVVVASEVVGVPWWAGLGLVALVLVLIGALRGVPRPVLTAQTVALLGFGIAGVVALALAPRAAVVVAGLALASHGVWDAVHYRRDEVVPRSMAEACILLDVPLGLGAIVLAFSA